MNRITQLRATSPDRSTNEPSARSLGEDVRLAALRKHGYFALAYSAAFQPDLDYFGDEAGFLAYKQVGTTAFVLSNPVAPLSECGDLIRRFTRQKGDVCFWQASRPVADILENQRFSVNEMGIETRIDLDTYDFDGPRKRNFRRALHRSDGLGYVIAEHSADSMNRREMKMVSERWRQTRRLRNREMTFLTRPIVLNDEIDVRKFFALDREGTLQAFAFFDPIYEGGKVMGYLCSAKRRLPEADALVGYAILHCAIRTFQNEGKKFLSLGLSPLCRTNDKGLARNRLVSYGFRLVYRSTLINKFIYPLQGLAAHKTAFCGSTEQTYYAFNGPSSLPRLLKMLRACNLA